VELRTAQFQTAALKSKAEPKAARKMTPIFPDDMYAFVTTIIIVFLMLVGIALYSLIAPKPPQDIDGNENPKSKES